MFDADVLIIGAGPAGAVAAANLIRRGYRVIVLEKGHFPRFVIGESLLPSIQPQLDEIGLGELVRAHGFQRKIGAAFTWEHRNVRIDFRDNWGGRNGEVFEVKRAEFDKVLIDGAEAMGAEVRYGQSVVGYQEIDGGVVLAIENEDAVRYALKAKFVFDASGYGRVLPRLLQLEEPSTLSPRKVYTTHIRDNITDPDYDRDYITIATAPDNRQQWLWLIPFSDGTASLGCIGTPEEQQTAEPLAHLKARALNVPRFAEILQDAVWEIGMPVREYQNYSANVKTLYGKHFALLGNAGEFLDPVFSSGVAAAVKSAMLACECFDRMQQGETVDWQTDYDAELRFGLNVFKTYVNGWYDERFQNVIYATNDNDDIRRYIASILAGYAWDRTNPFVSQSERRLSMLANAVKEYGWLT